MNEYRKWYYEDISRETISALQNHGIKGIYVENTDKARKAVLDMIPKGSSIGLGGSATIDDLDIIDTFREGDYHLFDRYKKNASAGEIEDMKRKSLLADYFITGTNAITMDGYLINIDGTGNRIAAMIYGPKKVIMVSGVNKIVAGIDEGIKRCRRVAARMNAKRFGTTPEEICNDTVIMGKQEKDRITVILIGDVLGF